MNKPKNICFAPFKGINAGKSVAVLGCGPTVKLYDTPRDIIHVGCNELIYSNISMDYYFVGDAQTAWPERNKTFSKDPSSYNAYQANIAKFVRDHPQDACSVLKANGGNLVDHAVHYKVCDESMTYEQFYHSRQEHLQSDIVNNYMYSKMSITWEMMQFSLWTGASRIYLIGHDCSYAKGSVHNPHIRNYGGVPRKSLIDQWGVLKNWAETNYPDVKIMCVNPDAMTFFDEVCIDDIIEG